MPTPPPIIFAGFLALGLGLQWIKPLSLGLDDVGLRLGISGGFFLAAALVGGWALRVLRAEGESPDFRKPSNKLATTGPYRWSRNPLYVSLTSTFLGFALMLDNAWLLLLVPVLVLVLDRHVIASEERYLRDRFGESYRTYSRRVRRWL